MHFSQNEESLSVMSLLQILLLGILSSMEPTIIYFQIAKCYDDYFPGFSTYFFNIRLALQLLTLFLADTNKL